MIKHYPKKLLVAALLLTGGGIGALAQTDVTSQYIKNASLSSMDGWTANNFNNAVQGSTKNDGYASEAYAGWGSLEKKDYSLTQKITLPAGKYELVNYSFYREGVAYNTDANTSRAYLKAGDEQVAIKTLGSIKAAGYANSQAEGANVFSTMMYRNTLDFTLTEEKTIEIGVVGTFAQKQSWCIVGGFQLLDMNKTPNAQDVTYLLTNPGFEYRDMTGWTLEGTSQFGPQANTAFDNKAGGYYAEKWQDSKNGYLPDGKMSQSLTGLTNGKYRVSAYIYFGGTGAYIQAGDTKTDVPANASGKYSAIANVTDGNLTIAAGLQNGTSNWVCFDRFTLEYLPDIIDDATANALIGDADAIKTKPMNADVKTALETAITNLTNNKTSDNYLALETAINNAKTSVDEYIAFNDKYLAPAAKLDEAGQANFDADKTVVTAKAAYNNGTIDKLTSEQLTALNSALVTAVKAQTTAGADLTLAIVNPSFEEDINTGWSQDGSIKFVSQGNNSFEKKDGKTYAEYWQPNGNLNIFQTVTALKSGVYRLTASIKARGVTSASVYAGDNSADVKIADAANDYNVEFATDGGDITIGVKAVGTGAGSSWVALDNFKLTLVSSSLPDVTAVTDKMNSDVESAQTKAIETYNNDKTVANYNAASAAIAAAKTSSAAYAHAKSALDNRAKLLEATNFYKADASFYDTPNAAYEAGSLTDAEANALEDPYGATKIGWHASTQINNFFGAAWGFSDYNAGLYINTWSNEGDTDGSNFKVPFYEYFTDNNKALAARTLTGTITGLKAGWYKVTLDAREQLINAQNTAVKGISMNVNDGESVELNKGIKTADKNNLFYANYTAYGQVGEDGVLKLNINVADGNNVHWLSFQHVKYEAFTPAEMTLDENATAAPATTTDAVIATLNRTFVAGWNSIVLPFATTTEALGAAEAAEYQGTENSTIYFKKTTELKANTPYLVYFNADKTNVTFNGVTIDPSTDITVEDTKGNQFDLVGTYVALAQDNKTVKAGDYIVVTKGIQKAAGGNVLKAYRAYLQAKSAEATAKNMSISIDGDTVTGIDAMQIHEALSDGNVYNLAGQRVGKDYKGIVIKNGKKVIKK